MEEKDPDHIIRPGVPEALDPSIGNGAIWESDPHDFNLKSVDPASSLDGLLIDEETRQQIIRQWNGQDVGSRVESSPIPIEDVLLTEKSEKAPEILESKAKPSASPSKPRKTKEIDWEMEHQQQEGEFEDPASSGLPPIFEPKESQEVPQPKSIGKVGKRVRKVVKKEKEKQDKIVKSETPEPEAGSMDNQLSPFTKWLKGLSGSDYVHPYEDDYGIRQMSGTARGGVSETFADLLAAQGYHDQARAMYQQLMEKYPEKSSFFAAKIEALK